MKDIDFDELDRAVSSVLNTTTAPEPTTATPDTTPVQTPAPAPVVSSPPSVSQTAPSPAQRVTVPSRDALAVRRGGRFMDVVHPSSDMKAPTASISRVAKKVVGPVTSNFEQSPAPAIQPEAPRIITPVPPILPSQELPSLNTSSDSQNWNQLDQPEPTQVHTQEWPDPLDVVDSSEAKEPESEVDLSPVADEPLAADVAGLDSPADTEPVQTPFLTDTKVDKRPLGAFAETPTEEALQVFEENTEPAPLDFSVPTTPEAASPVLTPDLVKVEEEGELAVSNEEPVATEVLSPEPEVVSAPEPAIAADIPPQYHVEEKAADVDTHSIFDTSTYHQPLLPQKTHSRSHVWVWVLLVLGLLIVGAGLGALIYLQVYKTKAT